ncbi:MAG: protein kinase [Fuerstiella sp.]|nr:protein kinase [Fuerstiella sp.]
MVASDQLSNVIPDRCFLCGKPFRVHPSVNCGDAVCPHCGVLVWPLKERKTFAFVPRSQFGNVYLCRSSANGRLCRVLNLAPIRCQDQNLTDLIVRNAGLFKTIRHENLLNVVAVGSTDERPFVAMEHEDGLSLWSWLQRVRRLSTGDAVNVLLQCANALKAIHDARLIHRFVSVDNVIVGRHGRVRLSPGAPLHAGGGLKFPEAGNRITSGQASGFRRTASSSDVYALGVMLYTVLTGQRPCQHDSNLTPYSDSVDDMTRSLCSTDPAISEALRNTIVCVLDADPAVRPDVTTFFEQLRETALANQHLTFLSQ